MNFKIINEILKDTYLLTNEFTKKPKYLQFVTREDVHQMDGSESQGDYNEYFIVWEIKDPNFKDIFLKVTIQTDSYGDNEFVYGIEFTKATKKTVLSYEPIN